ncbi:lon protease [Mycobacterium avium subsp. avium 2285 (R)]|nr:lon protease [Mycobacterium avium subsp. avium 2285 (R)]
MQATPVPDAAITDEIKTLAAEYKKLLLAMLQRREAWEIIDYVNRLTDPSALADTSGYASYLTSAQKRQLLETVDVAERLRVLIDWTSSHLAEVEVSDKIAEDVREGMEKTQKEFLLRQQLAAIRKELGEGEPDGSDEYRARVEAADLPEKVREAALREVGKLERASDQSPESGWIRTWLDTVLELPWNVRTDDSTDLKAARDILDADHHGLDDVKDRIVEYLAVRTRRAQRGLQVVGGRGSGAVMVLAGPPGVGKTSLGESVARALGRKFVRVALGGVRDEAEIRGHRRTYGGAAGPNRACDRRGGIDESRCAAGRNRQGRLRLPGRPERGAARGARPGAEPHVPRPLPGSGPRPVRRGVPGHRQRRREHPVGPAGPDGAGDHRRLHRGRQGRHRPGLPATPAAGAGGADRGRGDGDRCGAAQDRRRLHPRAGRATVRTAAGQGAAQGDDQAGRAAWAGHHRRARSRRLPGPAPVHARVGRTHRGARVATGLAVTGLGGDVLYIEAGATDGEPGLQLTGQLGDVMKESAQIALSYVRSHAAALGVDPKALDRRIHVHVPAGAVPKDGPSAGVTMVTALVSMATGRQVRSDVGMTGEVTLNGRVLPIGGVKQKLLAAQRAGLSTVFIPARNEPDLDDVPAEVLEALTVTPTTDVADIVAQALEPVTAPAAAAA